MLPTLALLLSAGGALSAPTHALVPSDDGPPSVHDKGDQSAGRADRHVRNLHDTATDTMDHPLLGQGGDDMALERRGGCAKAMEGIYSPFEAVEACFALKKDKCFPCITHTLAAKHFPEPGDLPVLWVKKKPHVSESGRSGRMHELAKETIRCTSHPDEDYVHWEGLKRKKAPAKCPAPGWMFLWSLDGYNPTDELNEWVALAREWQADFDAGRAPGIINQVAAANADAYDEDGRRVRAMRKVFVPDRRPRVDQTRVVPTTTVRHTAPMDAPPLMSASSTRHVL